MKLKDIIAPTKANEIKKLRAKIKSKQQPAADPELNVGWNQDPHQGNVPGAMLYR